MEGRKHEKFELYAAKLRKNIPLSNDKMKLKDFVSFQDSETNIFSKPR